MRRKNTRNARKSSPEKSKGDSPKRSRRQSSRRRKRSSSRSSYDSEGDMQTDIKESTQKDASVNSNSEQNSADGSKNYGELGDPARGRKHDRSKSSAGSETPERKSSGYDRPYSPSRSPLYNDDNDDSQDKEEEKEEKKNKGKSKGKNNSNIEQSSNNIEPETENENVQGTPQSPSNDNADNENVNVSDTLRSNSEEQEHRGTENEVVHDENVPQEKTEPEIHFESEYVHQNTNQSISNLEEERNQENEPSQNNKDGIENQDNIENKLDTSKESGSESNSRRRSSSEKEEKSSSKKHSKRSSKEERSTTPEPRVKEGSNSRNQLQETSEGQVVEDYNKSCEENSKEKNEDGVNSSKKKIILRRSPPENKESEKTEKSEQRSSHNERKSSTDENKKEAEAQDTKLVKKFPLRRPTVDERCSIDEKIDRKPEDLTKEKLSSKKRRRESLCEDRSQDVEEKPQRTLKPVKLIRNWSQDHKKDGEEKTSLVTKQKRKWTTSDWLNKLTSSLCKIDVDTIKIVCPSLQFLGENEVHLESTPKKERKISERKVSIDNRSEDSDRPEYEKQTSEESSGEIKIELNPNIIAMNRKISIVDDTASKLKPPPSPAKHPTSDVLFITNLVRPFTVKQLKELLERTGKIKEDGFWTDRIKSKCYVRYESVEEAEATRNALHGVHWPIGNGKKLVIDYAKVEDLEKAKNPAPVSITIPDKLPEKENREPVRAEEKYKEREDRNRKKRDGAVREWDLGKEDLRRGRTKSRSRSRERARKHSRRSFTPEDYISKKQRKAEDSVPQKLMDDLFLKTKATPSIYWQPLSPEEIETKQMQRLVRMEEHKRRIEETRGRVRDNRRGPFRRR